MNLQYITDDNGQTTGVFIPIQEWNDLKTKLKSIGQEELEVPEWQKAIVRERMETYKKNPERALDFDTAMEEIEKDL
ncbi:MAG: addiction module protein [Bacteroidota bacterium]